MNKINKYVAVTFIGTKQNQTCLLFKYMIMIIFIEKKNHIKMNQHLESQKYYYLTKKVLIKLGGGRANQVYTCSKATFWHLLVSSQYEQLL